MNKETILIVGLTITKTTKTLEWFGYRITLFTASHTDRDIFLLHPLQILISGVGILLVLLLTIVEIMYICFFD